MYLVVTFDIILQLSLNTFFTVPKLTLPYIDIRGACDKFPDLFRVGTFIDSTHVKLESPLK